MSLNSFFKFLLFLSISIILISNVSAKRVNIPEINGYNELSKDSLYTLLDIEEEKNLAYIHFAIGHCYEDGMYDVESYHYEQSLLLAQKYTMLDFIPYVYNSLGKALFHLGDIQKSLQYYMLALEKANDNINNALLEDIYSNLYNVYRHLGNKELTLDVLLKSLKYRDQKVATIKAISTSISVARLFYEEKQYESSLYYLGTVNEMIENYNNDSSLIPFYKILWSHLFALNYHQIGDDSLERHYEILGRNIFNSIDSLFLKAKSACYRGDYFSAKKDYSKALDFYHIAFNYYSNNSYYLDAATIASRIAHAEEMFGRYDNQLKYNQIAYDYRVSCSDSNAIYSSITNIGNAYINMEKFDSAFYCLNIADEYFIKRDNFLSLSRIANLTYKLYLKKGNFEEALYYYQRYTKLQDRISNETISNKVMAMRIDYERSLQLEREQTSAMASQRKQIYIYTMISFIVLFIVIFLLITLYNRNRISEDNIRLQQKLLRSQMNPHFIFNSLVAIQNYVYRKDTFEAVKYLTSFAKLMRLFLNNSREELISLRQEIETINYYCELQLLRFSEKFDLVISVDEKLDHDTVFLPPGIVQPFVENAIEHGVIHKEKGKISVSFILSDESLKIEILDNGDGIRKSLESKKESQEKHKSLATTITKERFYYLNRNIIGKKRCFFETNDIYSSMGSVIGTKVEITLPINSDSLKN